MKTQMNLVPFCFLTDWAVRAVLKISYFEGGFFMFFMGKTSAKNRVAGYIVSVYSTWGI